MRNDLNSIRVHQGISRIIVERISWPLKGSITKKEGNSMATFAKYRFLILIQNPQIWVAVNIFSCVPWTCTPGISDYLHRSSKNKSGNSCDQLEIECLLE